MMPDDMALVREYARSHSEAAFAALVERHVNLVYSVALRQVRDPHMAEEIAQAVFVILARKARALGPKVILPGWLCRTARYVSANALTLQRRRQRREQEACMQSVLNEPPRGDWSRIAPLLDDALARLGTKDHDAIVLRFFENRSLGEVGAAIGASEDTARMRVNRALIKLRQFFLKRGVDSTTAAIAETISANSILVAPAALAKTATAAALAKGATASTSTLTLIKGALKIMAWSKAKTAIVAGAVVLLAAGTASVVVVQKESLIDGKTESEWIASIVYRGDDNQVRLWHSIGTKGIQMLLRAMKPSPVVLTYERTLDRHGTVSYAVLTNGIAGIGTQERAGFLLGQLADQYDVKSAVPRVIKLLKTEKDDDVRATELLFFETPIQTMSEKEKAALLPNWSVP
jgi:RNA polymerase sigma factor (sigma-70 family)